jgi:hypothetical protein
MPASSVWVSGPHTPLEFSRNGEWVGCILNPSDTIHCWFTDYKGSVVFQSGFTPVNGDVVSKIEIAHGELPEFRFFVKRQNTTIRIVRLVDGTILAPDHDVDEFRSAVHR